MKIRVFLSAIRHGLEEARRVAAAAIEGPIFEAGSMELFGSRSSAPKETSLQEIDACHIFVAVLSGKYGSIPEGETKSFCQLEYEHALRRGRPILVYLYRVVDPESRQAEFIARVKTIHTVRPEITDPDHLAKCIVADLQFLVSDTFVKYITRADLPERTAQRIPLFLPEIPATSKAMLKEAQKLPQADYSKFVGRDSELKKIVGLLNPSDRRYIIAINGIGGVGKTSLALEAARRSEKEGGFKRYVWVSAKRTQLTSEGIQQISPGLTSLDDLLVHIALAENGSDVPIDSPGELYSAALASLGRHRTLLVVDNMETVDDPSEIGAFLARVPPPSKVLLTTREEIPEGSVEIRLKEFGIDSTRELLRNEFAATAPANWSNLSDQDVETIHDATGGIPVAIKWVLGLLMRPNASLEDVLRTLSKRDSEPLAFCFSNVNGALSSQARSLLSAFAQFSPEGTQQLASELSGIAGGAFDKAMEELRRFSLLNRNDRTQTYHLLPLTRDFVEAQMSPAVTRDFAEYKRRAIDICVARQVLVPLATLVDELARSVDEREAKPEVRRLEQRASSLFGSGKYGEAAEVAKGIIESDPKSLVASRIMARSLEEAGKYEAAIPAYHLLCNIEPGNPHNWIHLSIAEREQGNLGDSLIAIQRAITLDPMNVVGNQCLALLFGRMDRVQDARNQFQRTLELHPDNKPTLHAWAMLEGRVGNFQTSEKLFKRAFFKNPRTRRERLHNAKVADAYARLLEKLGHRDEAMIQVNIGLTYDPKNPLLRSLKDRLRRRG